MLNRNKCFEIKDLNSILRLSNRSLFATDESAENTTGCINQKFYEMFAFWNNASTEISKYYNIYNWLIANHILCFEEAAIRMLKNSGTESGHLNFLRLIFLTCKVVTVFWFL